MVLALAVRLLLFFGGIRGSDAYSYAQHAYNILNGGYDVTAETVYYGFRFPILLATAAAYALFGVGDWSSALFPLLASLITLVLVVRLGTVWFDRETGLWAGLLCAFYPMDVINASLLGPSSFIPCFSAAAVLSYWKAVQWGPDKAKGLLLCLVSGLCIGLAIQTRLVGILLLAVIGLMTFGMGRWVERLRAVLAVGMGCALPLSLESGYYLYKTGDPLYRLTIGLRWNETLHRWSGPGRAGVVGLLPQGVVWPGFGGVRMVRFLCLFGCRRSLVCNVSERTGAAVAVVALACSGIRLSPIRQHVPHPLPAHVERVQLPVADLRSRYLVGWLLAGLVLAEGPPDPYFVLSPSAECQPSGGRIGHILTLLSRSRERKCPGRRTTVPDGGQDGRRESSTDRLSAPREMGTFFELLS